MASIAMKQEFYELKETILKLCIDRPVYYFQNPGNWGDALIRHGTFKFFKEIGLDYTELNSEVKVSRDSVIIYAGSGAWCKLWNHAESYVRLFSQSAKVIVLPSSYESRYFISNTTFFVRDRYESAENMHKAKFCHDMAFYIDNDFTREVKNNRIGNLFRKDAESLNKIKIPENNDDISSRGNHLSDVASFFDTINRFSEIHTDRLHVAIAACLLKKEVHLHPGSYFKSRAVFKSSIEPYFENVFFHNETNP